MKKRALRKDFYMEIRKSSGRFLSIFFIVAIGVAFFSGIRAAEPDMRLSGDAYFDEKNLMDIQVVSTLGLTEEDVKALEDVDGICAVEAGYSADVLCVDHDSFAVFHLMSILPSMNRLTVEEGRLPRKADECAIDIDFLKNSGYQVGDSFSVTSGTDSEISDILSEDTFTIVGAVSSPCYIGFHRGSATIGDGSIDAFVSVLPESFSLDVYTELYASVDGAGEQTAFTQSYTSRVEKVLKAVEEIQKEREDARYQSIVDDAQSAVDDARKELEDARKEADQELSKAKDELDDGQTRLDDAKKQLEDGRSQMEASRAELISGQEELDAKLSQVTAQEKTLDEQAAALETLKSQYQMLLAAPAADSSVLAAMQAQISQGEAQITAGRSQLAAAREQLAAAQSQIDSGWSQYYKGQEELTKAQTEIEKNEQELSDGRKEYEKAQREAEEELASGEEKVQDAQEEIQKLERPKWYLYDRDDLSEYSGYGENADRMRAIGQVFPVLFFLVAALISLTTMTRMVEEQRTQIGTLKALGYDRGSVAAKYLGYAFLATVLGSVFGVLIGEKILPYVIITAYGIMYRHIPNVVVPYNLYYAAGASAAALACTLLATLFSCYRELKEPSAQLMRPPAPKQGKRVFLERLPFLWRRLNFTWKSTIRNLVRYKKRFFMTIFGIAGCMALLLVGFGLEDSISNIGHLQYEELQLYEGNLILNTDASKEARENACRVLEEDSRVEAVEVNYLKQVSVGHGGVKKDVYLNVPEDRKAFEQFIICRDRVTKERFSLGEEGIILTEKMAKMLDVGPGDTVTLYETEAGQTEAFVTAVCENYLQHYLYMTPGLYEKVYGEAPEYNCVYFQMKEGKEDQASDVGEDILEEEGALSVSYTADIAQQIEDMLSALDIVILVLVIAAGMLAFVVLYNLNNINITERKRELATLKVLGFYPREVSAYVYRENGILTVLGALAGIGLGKVLHQFIIETVEIETAMFGRNIDADSFLYGFLITVGFSVLVNLAMYFKLKKIDMVESLKSVE